MSRFQVPWQVFPALWALVAALALAAALLLQPGADEFCTLFGTRFGGECAFTEVSGYACPQCGMTRSFVWGARMHLFKAFLYNPAGLILFLWIEGAGAIGLARLVTRNPTTWKVPWQFLAGLALTWIVVYTLGWIGRVLGVNPLP
jgi:hypothetical protein